MRFRLHASSLSVLALASLMVPARSQTGIHPGFTLTSLRPAGFNPMVGGLDFLPDGRMVVVTWEGFGATKGSLHFVSGAQSGSAAQVTTTRPVTGLNEPLGVKVVDSVIYVLQKDKLTAHADANGDGVLDPARTVASGWKIRTGAGEEKNLEFAMGLVHKGGTFYGGLATAWGLEKQQSAERGCIISMRPPATGFEVVACGLRTPNGLVLGPDGALFTTENQGNWVPASKLVHVQPGRFYGVHKPNPPGPFDKEPESPPAIWMPHGEISISPTQPVYLEDGPFRGQMIAGDNRLGTLQRYFLEKVGGEWQGAVLRFSAGLEAGANRIVAGPDGAVYVGGIGTGDWSGWSWNNRNTGLQRLSANGQPFFDLLAVRSRDTARLELEFTEPVGAGAGDTARYRVRQWTYTPTAEYNNNKVGTVTVPMVSATVSEDKKRVTLLVRGLKTRHVVHITVNGLTAASGRTLWSGEAWYTLNRFGPGEDPKPVSARRPQGRDDGILEPVVRSAGRGLAFRVTAPGPFRAEVRDASGALREVRQGHGPADVEMAAGARLLPGRYAVTVRSGAGRRTLWLTARP